MVPALDNNNNIIDFSANNDSILLIFKQKIIRQTRNDDTKNVETMVPLKYLSTF